MVTNQEQKEIEKILFGGTFNYLNIDKINYAYNKVLKGK